MAQLINLSIDLTKIDKAKIKTTDKGKYYSLTVSINDTKDNYGNDVSCYDSQTKEERDAKAKRNYLGNGKVTWSSVKTVEATPIVNNNQSKGDDLPF